MARLPHRLYGLIFSYIFMVVWTLDLPVVFDNKLLFLKSNFEDPSQMAYKSSGSFKKFFCQTLNDVSAFLRDWQTWQTPFDSFVCETLKWFTTCRSSATFISTNVNPEASKASSNRRSLHLLVTLITIIDLRGIRSTLTATVVDVQVLTALCTGWESKPSHPDLWSVVSRNRTHSKLDLLIRTRATYSIYVMPCRLGAAEVLATVMGKLWRWND